MTIKISIDCMGGDSGPSVTMPAALNFLKREPEAELILVGREKEIIPYLKAAKVLGHPRLSIVDAPEVVAMDDTLEVALRRKKQSSMRFAIELVKEKKADVCVSAGNTGALMAISRYVLKTLAGIDRPAICAIFPNQKFGPTYVLDVGANVDCTPIHLHQFAMMGAALVSAVENKSFPTIGLLNVGQEDIKGNEVVKLTAEMLQASHKAGQINFYGNIEGNDIFEGTTDIAVCDGFVGNVTLKCAEGMGRLVKSGLTSALKGSILGMIGAFFARGALKSFATRVNPSRYNGATLLGLRGLVFKSHGGADAYAFEWALRRAYDAAKYDVLSRIEKAIENLVSVEQESVKVEASD
jgi:glycerol-3-phosphate acyltransferase PlsX